MVFLNISSGIVCDAAYPEDVLEYRSLHLRSPRNSSDAARDAGSPQELIRYRLFRSFS